MVHPRLELLRDNLRAEYHGRPQELVRIEQAFDRVAEGLQALGALGRQFWLAPGGWPEVEDHALWPRVFFHAMQAPNGKLMLGEMHLTDHGPGWHPTLEAAQHVEGKATQDQGRGGIRKSTELVLVR